MLMIVFCMPRIYFCKIMNDNDLLLYDHEGKGAQPDKGWQPGSSQGRLNIFIRDRYMNDEQQTQ